ncbi:LAMI_0D00298g1_1 [Lachancea mirantina]|uniref:LAMI_0D00298g1_1 n=1 Tax=Lachancea mirantina TaxID=1230905 RepID=A0A1G4J8D7_9SACH|nr:LAMI_0D00298g1_1 [Lachancea mirantina]
MSFKSIPVLDLGEAFDSNTKSQFLEDLRDALINVGFLLLTNFGGIGPNSKDFAEIKEQAIEFFELPDDVKERCEMIHSPHFLGYTRLGNEVTAKKADWREQIDLATELPAPGPGEPIYRQIEGPNLWPDPKYIPKFRPCVTQFINKMTLLSTVFRSLVCEAIGLLPDGFDSYLKPNQQCKMKIIAYPEHSENDVNEGAAKPGQGVGPHRDSDLLTYIFQASDHQGCLQVQNFQGQWISVDNLPGSVVVNVGQTLEAISDGVCKATIHRVLSPEAHSGIRLSIPFFQTIDLDTHKSIISGIPTQILRKRDIRDKLLKDWGSDVGFQYTPDLERHPVGYAVFRNRIKSHQDVAARWYPEILKEVLNEF